jgi:hypothetical protein
MVRDMKADIKLINKKDLFYLNGKLCVLTRRQMGIYNEKKNMRKGN